MDSMGQLFGHPDQAVVAGDVRANENDALTAIQTLFAREHNRIVALLPANLSQQQKFEIARRVVNAEEQYITYNEFLPALGVRLPAYRGYDPNVDPSLSNEFATTGFRAHSMVHGEFEVDFEPGDYSAATLDALEHEGVDVEQTTDEHVLGIPLSAAFGNPALLQQVGLGPFLTSLSEHQYKNDEQIDNTMRSVLFQIPKPGTTDPAACQTPVVDPACFSDVADLGADDIERGRDHGMPLYNDMRRAYGLPAVRSFAQLTGERTESLPPGDTIDSPDILQFTRFTDRNGNVLDPADADAMDNAVNGVRKATLAARLKAIYGSVDKVDAFVGMVSEPHVPGSDLGRLQQAIWTKQFTASRDGDFFFYANDPTLALIARNLHIDYRRTLADIVLLDTGAAIPAHAFIAPAPVAAAQSAPTVAPGIEEPTTTTGPATTGPRPTTGPAPTSTTGTGSPTTAPGPTTTGGDATSADPTTTTVPIAGPAHPRRPRR